MQETAYLWQLALKRAIAEADPRLAVTKIEKAELALFRRILAFPTIPSKLEAQAIFDALSTIRGLKARCRRHPLHTLEDGPG